MQGVTADDSVLYRYSDRSGFVSICFVLLSPKVSSMKRESMQIILSNDAMVNTY